ncbi:MAG: sigma-E factor negative regulatory protein [Luteibacter sp.]|uniref:sigma-E factor negative regulatory protein n=1 Tax=Luteibacter TaxID=242605 RepID=UPI000566ACDC|nr:MULTISPECIES: sigma-E factor negative regulatory protein [unclassified Luteibacter]MDQ7994724.1 sigma-E factor negative regulatory protein [Luteibacter sp.]MDR6641424.1 sigma-E factor negative regulatory protein RseA [Luteibacter sp. 1214]
MSEANREILSAGMDGELSREELRFLLRRIEADAGLADVWSRYHAGRDGLRGEDRPSVSPDFASRVMAAIDAESVVVSAAPRRRWLHWSAGGAIAASVAVAALMLSQPAGRHSAATDVAQHAPAVEGNEVADVSAATAPVAPQWLTGNNASQFTQKAAFDGSSEGGATYLPRSMPYQIHRARAAESPDGNGYMLLTRPDGSRYVQPVAVPQAR